MKIIYMHQYFNTPSMSGGTRSYEMARRLVAWGHEVHLITTDREESSLKRDIWRTTKEDGIVVHWTPLPYSNTMPHSKRIKSFLQFSWRCAQRAMQVGGDVVFATSTPLTIALPGIYASKKLGLPMVFEVRDLWPTVPVAVGAIRNPLLVKMAECLENAAYKNSAHIIALAPGMKDHIVAKGYPSKNITVIPNGADIELFHVSKESSEALRKEYEWLNDRPLIVYAGTIGAVNGREDLVDLAKTVYSRNQDVRFVVIGTGKEAAAMRRHATEAGVLNRNFFMLGELPKNKIPDWLAAATVCAVFFSGPEVYWRDSVSNKFFDCLAAKKPFISNVPGWSQVLCAEKGAGMIIDMTNRENAAEQLIAFLLDDKSLESASRSAGRLASEDFNRETLARSLESVLIKVCSR